MMATRLEESHDADIKNYYAKWFFLPFLVGVFAPPLLFLAWITYLHFSVVGLAAMQGQPIAVVTNPFIEISPSNSGANAISENAAFIIADVLCGLCAGFFGLAVGSLNRLIRGRRIK